MAKVSKTGRRWCFLVVGLRSNLHIEEILAREKRIRYAAWYIIKKERTDARGYIELNTPLKQSGMRKILGKASIVCFAKREREEIINEVENNKFMSEKARSYGERDLNKGGRPKKQHSPNNSNSSNSSDNSINSNSSINLNNSDNSINSDSPHGLCKRGCRSLKKGHCPQKNHI